MILLILSHILSQIRTCAVAVSSQNLNKAVKCSKITHLDDLKYSLLKRASTKVYLCVRSRWGTSEIHLVIACVTGFTHIRHGIFRITAARNHSFCIYLFIYFFRAIVISELDARTYWCYDIGCLFDAFEWQQLYTNLRLALFFYSYIYFIFLYLFFSLLRWVVIRKILQFDVWSKQKLIDVSFSI